MSISPFNQGRILAGVRLLEGHPPETTPAFDLESLLPRQMGLIRIIGFPNHDEETGTAFVEKQHERFLSGLYGRQLPWLYMISGDADGISICLGVPGAVQGFRHWTDLLAGVFPGSQFSQGPSPDTLVRALKGLTLAAVMTGNPSLASQPERESAEPATCDRAAPGIEILLNALRGAPFAYMVYAQPVPEKSIADAIGLFDHEEREVRSAFLRRGTVEEQNNPEAMRYVELIGAAREKYQIGAREGFWQVQTLFMTDTPGRCAVGMQSLLSAFSGPFSRPQPVRLTPCRHGLAQPASIPVTPLTTTETACITRFPSADFMGYRARAWAAFAEAPPLAPSATRLAAGLVMAQGRTTSNWFEISLDDLAKHAFVAGVPGAGKTLFCQYLLWQLWEEHQIPWLVIEPSGKSEYRRLLASGLRATLRIYTPGDERVSPFRFNPLAPLPGVPLQTLIDGISTVFKAAFDMEAPMPYILSTALHRIYLELGWDLTSGAHPKGCCPETTPCITDLLHAVKAIVAESGYRGEIRDNIEAALITRLSQFTLGSIAPMLNTRDSVRMDQLLGTPTVLELAAMNNDDEKAFLLGSLLLHLSLYRQSQGLSGGRLRHVTLVEEAHRLLRTAPEPGRFGMANPKGQAVESFCHLLAEVRAYGEGLIVAEQIPSKLAPDLIKNTSLKIALRITSKEDRDLLGDAMLLDERQNRFLATLPPGEAVVFAEGSVRASWIKIPNHAGISGYAVAVIPHADVAKHMTAVLNNGNAPLPPNEYTRRDTL